MIEIADHPLLDALVEQIKTGIDRRSATSCSRWAELYRIMPPIEGLTSTTAPLNHKYHPWTKAMRDETQSWVGPKAAQMGYTEVGLDVALFNMDAHSKSVLYLLPKKNPDATDFSRDRFDTAIRLSPHLSRLFDDVNNVGHKKAGSASLYIRGMQSKSGVKSVPVGLVIFDEYDEMRMANVSQALERMSGRIVKQHIRYSTPTIPDFGIDEVFKTTTQDHYFFKCPNCSRMAELNFPDDLVITGDSVNDPALKNSHYVCNLCHHPLPHQSKLDWLSLDNAKWISTANHDAEERGFYINQFYSFTVKPSEIAKVFIQSYSSPAIEQELQNSKGGKAYVAKGAQLSLQEIDACRGNYVTSTFDLSTSPLVTMGVDQGTVINFEITQWFITTPGYDINAGAFARVIRADKVIAFEELDSLMRQYQIRMCVMDHNPERRKAEEFAARFPGYVRLCYYPTGIESKSISEFPDGQVAVDRTSWIDVALNRFRSKRILLPFDIPDEYKAHQTNMIRRYVFDKNGNPVARYQKRGPDHYGHCRTYSEVALPLALSRQYNMDVNSYT